MKTHISFKDEDGHNYILPIDTLSLYKSKGYFIAPDGKETKCKICCSIGGHWVKEAEYDRVIANLSTLILNA